MMKSGFVTALVLAGSLMLVPRAGADCRSNCTVIFRFCSQGCTDNYTGVMRRACKIGCRKGKRSSIRACRRNPQICPEI